MWPWVNWVKNSPIAPEHGEPYPGKFFMAVLLYQLQDGLPYEIAGEIWWPFKMQLFKGCMYAVLVIVPKWKVMVETFNSFKKTIAIPE